MAIINGDGNDNVIDGTLADDTINGFGGQDLLFGHLGDDTLNGAGGDDHLYGQENGDTMNGGSGNDILDGGEGADKLNGGTGIDLVSYYNSKAGVQVVIGGVGKNGDADGDVIGSDIENIQGTSHYADILIGSAVANVLNGFGGDDVLYGLAGNDGMNGGAGDDHLQGGAGADNLNGGDGIDTASYADVAGAAAVTVTIGGVATGGHAQGDWINIDVENLRGSSFNDTLTGSWEANRLQGQAGEDKLFGLPGNDVLLGEEHDDVLIGGAGTDVLNGGAGLDTADYADSAVGVTAILATGVGAGGDAQGDTYIGIENLAGSAKNDILIGNASANVLQGRGGQDLFRGGAGADTLVGGDGVDTASYSTSTTGVNVSLVAAIGSGGEAQGDTLTGIENLVGSIQADVLAGNAGTNTLEGLAGNDLLRGGMAGDAFDGGADIDTVSYYDSAAAVSVSLATGAGVGGEAQGDSLLAIENLSGSQNNDVLEGNAGANVLQGWGGNDVLAGGTGKDMLSGGTGADRFDYTAPNDSVVGANADVIIDFNHGQADRIDLHLIDADTGAAGDQAFSFIGTALYSGVAGQLRYAVNGGVTTIAGDVDGDKVSDFHIQLIGAIGLVASDFAL